MTLTHQDGLDQHLDEALDRYATLLARTGYGVFRASPNGDLIDANFALAAILGYANATELVGVSVAADA